MNEAVFSDFEYALQAFEETTPKPTQTRTMSSGICFLGPHTDNMSSDTGWSS